MHVFDPQPFLGRAGQGFSRTTGGSSEHDREEIAELQREAVGRWATVATTDGSVASALHRVIYQTR